MKSSLVPAFQFVFSASFNSNDVYSCEYRHEKVERELTMAEILQIAQPQLSEYIGPVDSGQVAGAFLLLYT